MFLLITTCFPRTHITDSIFVDQYFASYPINTSWLRQRVSLDNLAIFLMAHPDYVGYIGFESGEKTSRRKAEADVNRAVKYLIGHRKVKRSQIIVLYLGEDQYPSVVLQPIIKGRKPPFVLPAN
jgi:hypothetical protein